MCKERYGNLLHITAINIYIIVYISYFICLSIGDSAHFVKTTADKHAVKSHMSKSHELLVITAKSSVPLRADQTVFQHTGSI